MLAQAMSALPSEEDIAKRESMSAKGHTSDHLVGKRKRGRGNSSPGAILLLFD
jgi:hypothetical protein